MTKQDANDFPDYKTVALSTLVPYARNSRTHSEEQVAQIAASIREFGFLNPIIVDGDNGIIAGHGRVLAAQRLGMDTLPCVEASHLTDAQRRAYVIADNKLALNAGWDDELLRVELEDLGEMGFDLELTGFSLDEIEALQVDPEPEEGLTDEDAVPEAPEVPVTVEGDVWLMGRHRIVCGDATDDAAWAALDIGDKFVCFSSPPYNVGDASGLRDKYVKGKKKDRKFYDEYDDDKTGDEYVGLLDGAMSAAFAHCDTVAFNLQALADSKRPLMQWMHVNSTHLVDVITWDKGRAAPHIQPGIMASRFEWIIVMARSENASRVMPHSSWQGKYSNVYQAPPQTQNEYAKTHGATFPVHLPEYMIGDLMNRCRGVVDCFLGTGTTIIAAEKLGREGRGIELSPAYCDVTIKRWQAFTGQQATLESTGETFDEVAHGREAPNQATA